ncbi:MAG: c-type cytochrome [Myxococcota bacterium]
MVWLPVLVHACDTVPSAPVPEPPPVPEAPAAVDPEPVEPVDELIGLTGEERAERLRDLGAAAYSADGAARCEVCHGIDGQGIRGAIPPLVGDRPWADDCVALASIVLFGTHDTFVRDGFTYVGVMPPYGERLDDRQVAAVATYVNGRWGTGPACEPADVSVIRLQGPMSRVE